MHFIKISFIIILVLYAIFLLYFSYKNGKIVKTILASALSGIVVFTIVNLISFKTGITISVNAWTLGSSALFGMPGVLGLLIFRMII